MTEKIPLNKYEFENFHTQSEIDEFSEVELVIYC